MVATMVTMTGPRERLADIARMAQEAIEGWLRDYDGYRGLVIFTDEDAGRARVFTLWETAEDEERSRHGRSAMRNQIAATADLSVDKVEVYDVPVFEVLPEPEAAG